MRDASVCSYAKARFKRLNTVTAILLNRGGVEPADTNQGSNLINVKATKLRVIY